VANTQAYYDMATITAVKSFIIKTPNVFYDRKILCSICPDFLLKHFSSKKDFSNGWMTSGANAINNFTTVSYDRKTSPPILHALGGYRYKFGCFITVVSYTCNFL
jgi:hypothetical protein